MICLLKANLIQTQARMKGYVDKRRSERIFEVGNMTFLHLQPYKQTIVTFKGNSQISPRFFGPYKVLQWVGHVAYKLELPVDSKIHHVFHVLCLQKKLGESILVMELPTRRMDSCSSSPFWYWIEEWLIEIIVPKHNGWSNGQTYFLKTRRGEM